MGKHSDGHKAHRHSVLAKRELDQAGIPTRRAREILDIYLAQGRPLTDREARDIYAPGQEMNYVRPRITELVGRGLLVEIHGIRCPTTGKTVRRCVAKGAW